MIAQVLYTRITCVHVKDTDWGGREPDDVTYRIPGIVIDVSATLVAMMIMRCPKVRRGRGFR